MTRREPTPRVTAITPFSKGFGYCVLEQRIRLVDWGFKALPRNADFTALTNRAAELVELYPPTLLVLPGTGSGHRSPRVLEFIEELRKLARSRQLACLRIDLAYMMNFFFNGKAATKSKLAVTLGEAFPKELGVYVPPPRKPWMSEDNRLNIFAA